MVMEMVGISGEGKPHPVQKTVSEYSAFQCAFYTAGFSPFYYRVLNENPSPDDETISEYLGGNICRYGCRVNILGAVKAVGIGADETWIVGSLISTGLSGDLIRSR